MADLLQSLREALGPVYQIDRLVGEGGMATVWLARDLRHNRPVALKLLRPEVAQAVGTERFGREIEVVARLNHPHILPLLDSGTVSLGPGWPPTPYFVMPYVEGETLRARLKRDKRLPESEALRIAREVAEGLDHAHRHGVLHRDIKPENILLSDGHAVIADFGIARAADEMGGVPLTRTGQTVGTPAYMSPEQITGDSKVDGRSDLYALGCMLFEMLTGTAPGIGSLGGSISGMLARRLAEDAPSVRSLNPTISGSVDEVVQRTLARDPGDRFATPGEFAQVLSALTTGERFTLSMPRQRGRRAGLAWGIALVLVAGALGSVQLLRSDPPEVITRLAVAPLAMPENDSTASYLGEGVQEAVVDLLRRLPRLGVTAPTLVRQVLRKEPALTVEELGERLSVGAVLEWTLRRAGDSLHLRAELVKIPGGTLLWSGRYDRAVSDVLSLQGEIARTIGDSLRLQLGIAEISTLSRNRQRDPVAYDLVLRGKYFSARTPYGVSFALANTDSMRYYADRAVERDSTLAEAYSLLAEYFTVSAIRGYRTPFGVVLDSGWAAASRALALDSSLGRAWSNRGVMGLYSTDDWPTVARDLRRGVQLAPDVAFARQFYGIYLGELEGELDSAITHARQAVLLEPESAFFNTLGDLFMRARQYDSAMPVLREALRLDPRLPGPWTRLIQVHERTGRWAEAVEARRRAPDTTGAAGFAEAFRVEGAAGYRRMLVQEVRRRIDSLRAAMAGPPDTVAPLREGRIALLHAQLGEWREATDWVLRELARRPRRLRWFVAHPDLAGLRNDPRFLALVREQGLEGLLERVSRRR